VTTYAYVDNSNLYIEGCRVAAVKKGMAKNIVEAMNKRICDLTWQMDYGKLYEYLCDEDAAVARLWGSPPPGDSFWEMVKRKGFDPITFDRNFVGKEKKVDVALAGRMMKDAYDPRVTLDKSKDEMVLVSGDSDYVPIVETLVADGFKVHVAFWDHAARELRDAASRFISLNDQHGYLTRA
jgi:hypothetical protein